MSFSSAILALLPEKDREKLAELLSKDKEAEILKSLKQSWKSRVYAAFLLRLHNLSNKKWRIFHYKGKEKTPVGLLRTLELRSVDVTDLLKTNSLTEGVWFGLGASTLRDTMESYSLMSWSGKWEALLFEDFHLLLCDEIGDTKIEEKEQELKKRNFQIERKKITSGQVRKLRKNIPKANKKLHWRKLWVGEGLYDAGIQTITIEGEKDASLSSSARNLASKADGFNPSFEKDGAEVGWKIGENLFSLSWDRKSFKPVIQAESIERLINMLDFLSGKGKH